MPALTMRTQLGPLLGCGARLVILFPRVAAKAVRIVKQTIWPMATHMWPSAHRKTERLVQRHCERVGCHSMKWGT